MTERLPCKSEGCKATILPATAAKTGGYCMPCVQEQERRKRQAYIEEHRKTVNLYEGLTAPVEILKLKHTPRRHDPLIQYVPYPLKKETIYAALSVEEAEEMLDYALQLLAAGDLETSRDILSSLVCYRNHNIAAALSKLMECGMLHPGVLYKDAAAPIRDRLLQRLDWDDDHRNSMLLALSWIGDEQVLRRFREWRENQPSWAERLYVAPETYAREAGWELTPGGERRDLIHSLAYSIAKREQPSNSEMEGVARFLNPADSNCPWCGGKLDTLMDVDTAHPSLSYLELAEERLQIQTCVRCGCYGVIYMEYDSSGVPGWSRFNRIPDYLQDLSPEEYDGEYLAAGPLLTLSSQPHSAFYTTEWGLSQHNSQIGGHPSWVQDAEYPACPCCAKSMVFIGQLDWEDFEEYGEGIYYMFLCQEDRLTATVYQQS